MSRIFSWLSTKNGRRFTHMCVGGVTLAVFGNYIAVRGPMLDRVIDLLQVYKSGKPRQLPDKVNVLIDEVLSDSKLKEEEKKKLKFFYGTGHEIFHFGAVDSPWGMIVGIPFTFEDVQDIKFSELRLHGREQIDWAIDGQDLLEALTLSESAKKFAVMREVYSCNFSDMLGNAAIAAACVLLPGRFAQQINKSSRAFEILTMRQRNVRYLFLYSCGLIFYRLIKDPLKHFFDKEADKLAAETSPEYLTGGIEYYKKELLKNKALQEISETKFWNKYDENGNEKYFILAPRLPIAKRLQFLREMQEEKKHKVEDKKD